MRTIATMALLALISLPALAADLRVEDARAAPPLPGTGMMAGYLTLVNAGNENAVVRGASSRAFGRIELHRSVHEDGQARMEPVESITLTPGERVAFEPGGLHLMMFEPAGEPGVGDRLPLQIETGAGAIATELRVIDRSELLQHSHH